MNRPLRPFRLAVLGCLLAASAAHAQVSTRQSTALPVLDRTSGKVEAVLLLEPVSAKSWQFGNTRLDTVFGLQSGDQLGLVCDRTHGLTAAIGNLADNCLVASFGENRGAKKSSAGASVSRPGGRVGLTFGTNRDALPPWLAPGARPGTRIEENTLMLKGERNLGREATVSIGGTLARARLVRPEAVPGASDRWNVSTLSLGASVGQFGANVIGRVLDSPASAQQWQGLDLGLTWRTPWSGQLSVGAENVVTRGKNPFAPAAPEGEDTVPYVRYQQDL